MNRRDLLGILGGVALAPALLPLSPERRLAVGRAVHSRLTRHALRTLDPHQNATVTRIAELILPETDTPGATTVNVNQFVDLLLTEWYPVAERDRFLAGLADIDARSRRAHGTTFVDLSTARQTAMLRSLDGRKGPDRSAGSAFATLKSLTIYGYFTSEVVMKQVTKYQIIPGRFDGCIPI